MRNLIQAFCNFMLYYEVIFKCIIDLEFCLLLLPQPYLGNFMNSGGNQRTWQKPPPNLGRSSIPPVSVNRQEILVDYRYLGRPKISIHKKMIQNT